MMFSRVGRWAARWEVTFDFLAQGANLAATGRKQAPKNTVLTKYAITE